jgi:phage shock protein PspC (stress-responsive transcriptional regulator)
MLSHHDLGSDPIPSQARLVTVFTSMEQFLRSQQSSATNRDRGTSYSHNRLHEQSSVDNKGMEQDMNTQWTRSRTEKMIGGVAGGIAERYGWDPTLVRLGFVLLAFANGFGVLLYLIMLVVMRQSGSVAVSPSGGSFSEGGPYASSSTGGNRLLGYVLLGIGALVLANMLNLTGPMIAVLLLAAGWHLIRSR